MKVKAGKKTLKIKDCPGLRSIRGLMFDKKHDGALIYANNIWMIFISQPLDLFFLDEKFKVLESKKAIPLTLHPSTWKIYSCAKAKYCLEVKAGLVKDKKIEIIS